MEFPQLAHMVLLLHLAFVLFVLAGGLLVLRWHRLAWLHLPAVAWGAVVELTGWFCPLTGLENRFRRMGGRAGYEGSFVEHYLVPLIYPPGLTPEMQFMIGVGVLIINGAIYSHLWRRVSRNRQR